MKSTKEKKAVITLKKFVCIMLVMLLVVLNFRPLIVVAQEEEVTPTPTPIEETITPSPSEEVSPTPTPGESLIIENSDQTVETQTETVANTGNNGDPSDTPTPSISQAPENEAVETEEPSEYPTPEEMEETDASSSSDGSLEVENTASVQTEVTTSATTGDNVFESLEQNIHETLVDEAPPEETPTPSPAESLPLDTSIETGSAVSVAMVDNTVNSTSINSEVVYQTVNLYMGDNGVIDLSLPSEVAEQLVLQNPDDPVIAALIASGHSDASVVNEIDVSANTGNNTAEGDTVYTTTGDAYAILSLLNRVNVFVVDSVIHVVTINIFGDFYGDIYLPDPITGLTSCGSCGGVSVGQDADVSTVIQTSANTGGNSVTADSGEIVTGDANASAQVVNLVNTSLIDSLTFQLYIMNYGVWNGSFLGWGDATATTTGAGLYITNGELCETCIVTTQTQQSADLQNVLTVSSNTGGNTVTAEDGTVHTGDAYTAVSVVNMVNTTFVRSFGFFGFINIFGSWTGNIGAKSLFPTPSPLPPEDEGGPTMPAPDTHSLGDPDNTEGSDQKDSGGHLTVSLISNVGEYVYPGDTVTFFADTKNDGSGRVYNGKLELSLIKDGEEVGSAVFSLGSIGINKIVRLTTGMVLSENAPFGSYTARATVTGIVGPDNHEISGVSETQFDIASDGKVTRNPGTTNVLGITSETPPTTPLQVDAYTEQPSPRHARERQMKILLIGLLTTHMVMEGIKKRREIAQVAYSFRMFL